MEITVEAITAALTEKPELVNDLAPVLLETDKIKEVIGNKAEAIYKEKITGEVSQIHSQYDKDMEEILGEKPGQLEDGSKQKTYDKIKGLYSELKDLRGQKDSLSKDAEVARLKTEINDLKTNGPGAHWEETFKKEREKWLEEKNSLNSRLSELSTNMVDSKKRTDIEAGLRGFKFKSEVPETARQALIDLAINKMVKNSKVEEGKVIYLDDSGAQINDNEYKPESAKGILSNLLKEIIQTKDQGGGGGAPTKVVGSIESVTVEGTNTQRLALNPTDFKTKSDFVNKAEEALLASGIARGSDDWDKLKNEAYQRYGVQNMPR